MPILLGFLDSKIKDEFKNEPWKSNKIGGHLCLPSSIKDDELNDLKRYTICDRCNNVMIFIGQINCPLEIDSLDRFLILFACNTMRCGQWSIIRYIQDVNNQSISNELDKTESNKLKTNWLDDEDNWNEPDNKLNCELNCESNDETNLEPFEEMNNEQDRFIILNENTTDHIQAYHLNVEIENQTDDSIKLDEHINELLKNYKDKNKNDKNDKKDATDEYTKIDETDILENYNNDVQTYKFYKKLSLVSGQVIRYGWNENALLNSSNIDLDQTSCDLCGSIKVFEFQLMPALINYLRFKKNNESLNLDFASVLVFTCKDNCSKKMLTKESYLVLEENEVDIPDDLLAN